MKETHIHVDMSPLVEAVRAFQSARFCTNCGQERGWYVGTCRSGSHTFARHRYQKQTKKQKQ